MTIWSGFLDYSEIYSASRGGAWRWSVCFVASLKFFFSGEYLRLQNSTKCHFNRPGKTRRRSVKGFLALFCYILTFGLSILVHRSFDDSSYFVHVNTDILTHTTSGPPVIRSYSNVILPFINNKLYSYITIIISCSSRLVYKSSSNNFTSTERIKAW